MEEVGLRLMRYAIECKHLALLGVDYMQREVDAEFEEIYEGLKTHPRFAEMLAEVESGKFIICYPPR
jgi:hypothetical protein